MITKETFDKFTVYKESDLHQFCFVSIDSSTFYEDFSSYILDFQMIKKHATINLDVDEELSLEDYNEIYNRLINFVDFEKIINVAELEQPIIDILDDELEKDSQDIRKDKWGRIGEYVFNIILDTYFNLDCIIRKFAHSTSRNMPVYGIDTLHCSLKDKIIFFGESKMVKDISNGIKLIQKSLLEYEAQILEEYYTIKNNNFTRSEDFLEIFKDSLLRCLSFNDLIKHTGITTIGIPIFISHAGDYTTQDIFEKLKKIPTKSFFGLTTQYYIISLPVIDKNKFREAFIGTIQKKIKECRECIENAI